MAGIANFYGSLNDSAKDIFLSVANDLHASSPQGKIERLNSFMSQLKEEIDQINKRRQALGEQLNSVEMVIAELTKYLVNNEDLELLMFRASLMSIASQLKTDIFSLKPDNKLAKKFDVARRRDSLVQRQLLANKLFGSVLKDARKSKKTENSSSEVAIKKEKVEEKVVAENVLEDVEQNSGV